MSGPHWIKLMYKKCSLWLECPHCHNVLWFDEALIVYSLKVYQFSRLQSSWVGCSLRTEVKKTASPITEKTRIRVLTSSLWHFLRWVLNEPFITYSFLVSLFHFVLSQEKTWLIVLSSLWMGHAMYFSLGNSNSLASIDVSAGYVGLEDYVPGVVGPLMYVATYCGPILWLIAAVLSIVRDARDIKR